LGVNTEKNQSAPAPGKIVVSYYCDQPETIGEKLAFREQILSVFDDAEPGFYAFKLLSKYRKNFTNYIMISENYIMYKFFISKIHS
jgi:hypothetical protein